MAAVAPITELRSSVGRLTPGPSSQAELDAVIAADTEFALRLYHELVGLPDGNLFFSPFSISTALSMAYAGARGDTAAQMADALGVGPDDAAWHAGRNRLELDLASSEGRPQPYEGDATPMTLETTNTIFGQQNYAFRDAFLDVLAANYDAGMQAVDFGTNPEAARAGINAWVAERTRDRIKELLAKGTIDGLTRAVLVNAIYFKANWIHQFDPDNTSSEPFHLLDGSTIDVQTMHLAPRTGYLSRPGWQAVRLHYWGGASMVAIVPDQGQFAQVEGSVDTALLGELDNWGDAIVHLSLPRWESASNLDLVPQLEALGIVDAFDPLAADLSGTADFSQTGESLYISHVAHQANITVTEEGTEAAAATAVIDEAVSRPQEVTLTIDRPFIYLIRDDVTDEILFMGRLLEP